MTSSPPPPHPPPTDVITRVVGEFGIWQLRSALVIFLCKIPASWFMACIIFTAPELLPGEYMCASNATVREGQCQVYDNATGATGATGCDRFVYATRDNFYSLVMQFDLLCERDILVAWTQFWHLFGILVGGVVATKMMIWMSPKRVMTTGMLLLVPLGCLTGYIDSFNQHCFFRCLSAVCCSMMMTSGQTIFTDITNGAFRIGLVILYDTFWSLGLFFLPALASLFSSWSQIYLGISLPTIILLLLLRWIPESPRWLLAHDKDSFEAQEILLNGAAINDRLHAVPDNFKEELDKLKESTKKQAAATSSWWQLWSGKRAKVHFIAAHVALAVYIINYMGLLLNTRSFGRDYLAVNTIVTGASEVIGCFLALHIVRRYGSMKWQCSGVFNIMCGLIGCLGWLFPETLHNPEREAAWMLISACAKCGVSLAQSMLLACLPELWPPAKRAPFMFSVVTWARIWLLIAPFINVLKRIDVAMSLSTFSVLSVIGGVATLFLRTPVDEAANKNANKPTVWTVSDVITRL